MKLFGYELTLKRVKPRPKTKTVGFTSLRWTVDDTIHAIQMVNDGHTSQEIASSINRTVEAINTRKTIWRKKGQIE